MLENALVKFVPHCTVPRCARTQSFLRKGNASAVNFMQILSVIMSVIFVKILV